MDKPVIDLSVTQRLTDYSAITQANDLSANYISDTLLGLGQSHSSDLQQRPLDSSEPIGLLADPLFIYPVLSVTPAYAASCSGSGLVNRGNVSVDQIRPRPSNSRM